MSFNVKGKLAALVLAFAFLTLVSSTAAQADLLGAGALVRQDFSDCGNSDVSASNPSNVGGRVAVLQTSAGATTAMVLITNGTPGTSYHLFWKCQYWLGQVQTDANGVGVASFTFQATAGQTFAFDMYPDGAPLGNKFQSVPVTPTLAIYGGGGSLVRQMYSDCGNSDVTASNPSTIGGYVTVVQQYNGLTAAIVQITNGAPDTAYHFFWKCHDWLGQVQTDSNGVGAASFAFQATAGQTFAFDMYPDGAWDKYQSVPVALNAF